jgi:hypothetical protein
MYDHKSVLAWIIFIHCYDDEIGLIINTKKLFGINGLQHLAKNGIGLGLLKTVVLFHLYQIAAFRTNLFHRVWNN